jgi:hypothetical protein
MTNAGDVISHIDMCKEESASLQRGMNFRLRGGRSVILMSRRRGAPYEDRLEEDGRVLVYEGHDVPRTGTTRNPKKIDQPYKTPSGRLTQNGLFFDAAQRYKRGEALAELVRVYEKIKQGIWVYNGTFRLTDAWTEPVSGRTVFRYRLELEKAPQESTAGEPVDAVRARVIPSHVKLAVWKRDRGKCVLCGSTDNLHFDHDVPYSKGGSSMTPKNIRLLCARHNLAKHDRIE